MQVRTRGDRPKSADGEESRTHSVDLERGMDVFSKVKLLLLLMRMMQRLEHRSVHELLLWLKRGGLPGQGGEPCPTLQHNCKDNRCIETLYSIGYVCARPAM